MYKDLINFLSEIIKDRVVCEIHCGSGNRLKAMEPIAKQVFGIRRGVRYRWWGFCRGLKIINSDCYVDPLPPADVYLITSHSDTSVYFLIHKILSNRDFHGTVVILSDAGDEKQRAIARHCARIGHYKTIESNQSIFSKVWDVVVIKANEFLDRTQTEKRAVVSLAIGKRVQSLKQLVEPLHRYYANRIGADHIVLDQPRVNDSQVHYEKFQIYECLEQYDRIVYIDIDAIPRPDCPDLFELVPKDCVGVAFERAFFDEASTRDMNKAMEACHEIDWGGDYFNSGVMVVSKQHREMFNHDTSLPNGIEFSDQTMLNYRVARDKYQIFNLGPLFNFHKKKDFKKTPTYLPIYIAHFAGRRTTRLQLATDTTNNWYHKKSITRDQSIVPQSMVTYASQVPVTREVEIVEQDDGSFLVSFMDLEISMNTTSVGLLNLCNGTNTVSDIIKIVSQPFLADSKRIKKDVINALNSFLIIGLIYDKCQFIDDRSFIDSWQMRLKSNLCTS